MIINKGNYEVFVLDYLEGNLSQEGRIAFESFMLIHPEIKQEIEEFEMISVLPDPAIKHPKKDTLFQIPQQKAKRKIAPLWWYVGIAASFLLLLYIAVPLLKTGPIQSSKEVVQEDTKRPESNPKIQEELITEANPGFVVEVPMDEISDQDIAIRDNLILKSESKDIPFKETVNTEIRDQVKESDMVIVESMPGEEVKIDLINAESNKIEPVPLIPSLDLMVIHVPVQINEIDLLILNIPFIQEEASGLKKWLAKINIADKIPDKSDLKESLIPEFIAMR